ncbi:MULTISPECIES: GH1 family beta-glucosidase [Pontibacillus]|uniref:Beta-glucosidase n=1 Tax=Pontibacillus chungwhensis TaxID=265426 RepID=A0ABY8V1B5_9BACI|nr:MULTISPECIES: GH1 family beta-glucosidase [Pontibacillus]MCD5322250.1 beta-glucosidase [Pontibacillus sp. HN14]WIF99544.1 GH1 family beta-glucosidase [Pontibacillus chungwhensis]
MQRFKEDFIFGTATSSYQIEGAVNEAGRTPSIWDTFSLTPGKVNNGDTGDVACDHYNRFEEDIEIIKSLGVDSYRFSIAWPRVFPHEGQYNPEGMAFYKRLATRLKEEGIRPFVTLYHWDLPQWAYEKGGWTNRESINWFMEFAEKCFEELDDVVDMWITHNEPWCVAMLGYYEGVHAPGHQNLQEAIQVAHHLLLSHGMAVQYYKETLKKDKPIGITLNLSPVYPASVEEMDYTAAQHFDGYLNRWFLDPVFKGSYPEDMKALYGKNGCDFDFIHDGDLELISIPCDFFGINFYNRALIEASADHPFLYQHAESDYPKTGMGWDISPNEFRELIYRVREDYTRLPIFITENGAAFDDQLEEDGTVKDEGRKSYVEQHLETIAALNEEGMGIQGYYLWSLLDNFEWAFGYDKRFGITYVDFKTQKRYVKDSAKRYTEIVRARTI